MSARDLSAGAVALAQCRAMLGGEYDAFGRFWNQADRAARSVLLRIAGQPSFYECREWSELAPEARASIKRRARDLRGWLVSLPLDAEKVAA